MSPSGITSPAQQASVDSTSGSLPAAREAFLQLLVAQIKNQNPLNPTDGVQFLTQLSQFTEMEQMLGMRQDIAAIRTALEAARDTAVI